MAEKETQQRSGKDQGGLVPVLVLSCAINVALGLGMVLISIERTELSYGLRQLESAVKTRGDHASELEVERGRLLSPYVLEKKAAEFGMRAAEQGQIRRMGDAALDTLPK